MAITKIFTVHKRLDHLLDYIADAKKTGGVLITGVGCAPETVYDAMTANFALNDKPLRVQGYHVIQSFAPDDDITALEAHEVGVKLAEKMFSGFQCLVCTHTNTLAYHNHIAVCSTSFIDGHRYHSCKESNARLREASDSLCRIYGLSIIEHPKRGRYKSAGEVKAERSGKPMWKTTIKEDVDECIAHAKSPKAFIANLEHLGYEVKCGKEYSVRPPGKERFVRLGRSLGDGYSIVAIHAKIREHSHHYGITPVPKQRTNSAKPKPLPAIARGSIVALYRHYLYLMGYYQQRSNGNNARMHYLLRDDIRRLEAFIDDTRLLGREGIHTIGQLEAFRKRSIRTIEKLTDERKPLYCKARLAAVPDATTQIRGRITEINASLKHHRKELRQCDRIEERQRTLPEKVAIIELGGTQQKQTKQRSANAVR